MGGRADVPAERDYSAHHQGPDVSAEDRAGQSVTGSLVLHVGGKGGILSYIDDPSSPAFRVALPAA